ncbi:MAG: hypothetical protein DIU54_004645 [Acidobacteriota bacterium]|jgi:opacity protein-like surface antigen|nr:MAG: hypothetical protein DIU54_10030 [Acidobacteriota bacterium]
MTNFRKVILPLAAALAFAVAPAAVQAQDFGLLESAETIDRGTFKLRANPMFIFGKNGQGDEAGAAIRVGYGVADRFDIEGGIALYDDFTFFGADAEFWLMQDRVAANPFDLSVILGFHLGNGDRTPDTRGFDLTFLASKRVSDRTELYGGLDIAFEALRNAGIDHSYTPVHFVPGIEYRLARDLDLVGEVGVGLSDEARHYIGVGLAVYFR